MLLKRILRLASFNQVGFSGIGDVVNNTRLREWCMNLELTKGYRVALVEQCLYWSLDVYRDGVDPKHWCARPPIDPAYTNLWIDYSIFPNRRGHF